MVSLEFCKSGPEKFWRGCPKKSGPPPTTHHPHPRSDPYIYQSIGFNLRIPDIYFLMGWTGVFQKLCFLQPPGGHQKKGKKNYAGIKHSLHQLRKRRHIGPKCRESPPPKEKENLWGSGGWLAAPYSRPKP